MNRARPGNALMLSVLVVLGLALGGCGVPNQPEVVVVPDATVAPETPAVTDTDVTTDTDDVTTDAMTDTTAAGASGATVALPGGGVADADDVFVTATSLLDYDWQNLNGDVSGEIEDLLIDLNTGRVLFATLEYGGVLELGDTELPVPLNAFVWGPEGQLILNIEEERLQDFPNLDQDWPNLGDATWDDDALGYWRDLGLDPGFDFTEATDRVGWVSNLVGYPVGDVGLGVGNVTDMWIDLGQNYVSYLVLGYGAGTLANRPVAVPFGAFDMQAFGDQFVFAPGVDTGVLEGAPVYDDGIVNVVPINPDFDDDLNTYWAERGYVVEPGAVTPTDEVADTDDADDAVVSGVAGAAGNLILASTLLDYGFQSLAGDTEGELEDMLIDTATGRILYATVEYGGFLEIGDTEAAVLLSAFTWSGDNELVLNISDDSLAGYPNLGAAWPNLDDPTWDDQVVDFWNNAGVDPGTNLEATGTVMRVSELIGEGLFDVGFGAGTVNNLLIDLEQAYAPYVILDYGEALFENNVVAVPFGVLDVQRDGDDLVITPTIDLATLEGAPFIERDAFDDDGLFDATFDDDFAGYWEEQGYSVAPVME